MKNFQLLLFLCLIGCQNQEKNKGFVIKGEVKNLNNNELLVVKFVDGGMELDSILVLNNKFEYTGIVKEPYFVQLLLSEGNSTKGKLTEFMIENAEIIIEGSDTNFDSIQVSGSKSDRILKEYFKKDEALSLQWNLLKIEYDTYVESNDTINQKEIKKKLNTILKINRVGLLKRYVKENSHNIVGPLLPIFCTLENVLTENDYEEMYNTLGDEIRKTDYGQTLFQKFNMPNN